MHQISRSNLESRSVSWRTLLNTTVVVSSLGYFVDIYDLILFSIVRIPSLKSIGVSPDELMHKGMILLNMQMGGMLIGGILWGMLGDKKGRVSVLYGSILLYSLANLANAFVVSFPIYASLRFLAGIGLAGELGAAVTLVTEVTPKSQRGYAVAFVAAVGILGAIFAAFVSETFSWQTAYIVGGTMGLLLLVFRMKMQDSSLFTKIQKNDQVEKGNFLLFFSNRKLFFSYLACIFVGSPNWFIIGILVTLSPEITAQLSASEPVLVSTGIAWLYVGLSLGDLLSGFLSQWIRSRKKVLFIFITMTIPIMILYLTKTHAGTTFYYPLFFVLGICNGYWAVGIMTAAEQFGTNLRATATTTVPNFIRAMVIPMTLGVQTLTPNFGLIKSIAIIAVLCIGLSYIALWHLQETYHRDLDFNS